MFKALQDAEKSLKGQVNDLTTKLSTQKAEHDAGKYNKWSKLNEIIVYKYFICRHIYNSSVVIVFMFIEMKAMRDEMIQKLTQMEIYIREPVITGHHMDQELEGDNTQ